MAIQLRKPEVRMTVWDPVRDMRDMERRFRGSFNDLLDWRLFPSLLTREMGRFWAPSIELIDKGGKYLVRAELPGMKTEDIEVSIDEDGLTISGERKQDKTEKEEHYVYQEHSYGAFRRTVPLPTGVDHDKVEASYENGILEVTLTKTPETKAKKIEISSKVEKK